MLKPPETKNQRISRLAARTAVKAFIIILLFGLLPFITGQQSWDERLEKAHFIIPNKWTLIFPALLFAGFLVLLVTCLKNKYREPDFNWLLVLNIVILLAYLVLVYIRLYKVVLV